MKIECKVVVPLIDPIEAAETIKLATDIAYARTAGGKPTATAASSGNGNPGVIVIRWNEVIDA